MAMPPNAQRATVLLVGDERPNVGLLRDMLKDDFELRVARDAPEAMAALGKQLPGIVLCDVSMPRLEGIGTCKRIRQSAPRVPVILVTSLAEDTHEVDAFEAGAVDYVRMPVSARALLARIRAHLVAAGAAPAADTAEPGLPASGSGGGVEPVVRMLTALLQHHNPRLANYATRAGRMAGKVAAELRLSDSQCADVYHAGLLHELGKIGFSEELADKPLAAMSEDEMMLFKEHPNIAEQILLPIVGLVGASNIIAQQNERIDGLGFPQGLSGDDVPIGVSILSAVRLYLDLVTGRRGLDQLSMAAALVATRNEVGRRFPRSVMDALERVVVSQEEENIKPIELDASELEPGMVLARDWRTNKGVLLLAAGLVLTDTIVRQIRSVALKRGAPIMLHISPVDSRGRVVQKRDSSGENALIY